MANCLELDIRNKNVYVRLYNVIENMEMRLDTIEKHIVSSYDSIKKGTVMNDYWKCVSEIRFWNLLPLQR